MAIAEQAFLPIAELSAYQTKWVIKARVTNKAPLRQFSKGNGEGKVFHVELLDAAGGEIRASFFNQAADKFHDKLEKGKCFTFSRGSVKIANKQYNPTNHRYELTFDKDAQVEAASDDSSIKEVNFNFVSLRTVQQRNLPTTVDLCGVITSFEPTITVTSKEGVELVKRDITIADDTATSMKVALWADRAKQDDKVFQGNPMVSLKSVSVKEWKDTRAGSLSGSGALVFNQDSPQAKRVQEWWKQGGSSQELTNLSQLVGGGADAGQGRNATQTGLAGVRIAAESLGSEPAIFSVVARLARVQTTKRGEPLPLHYMAFQELMEGKDGRKFPTWKRVEVHGEGGKVEPRVITRCQFADFEDQAWITSFHEASTKILGMSGDEIRALELAAAEKGEAGREELEAQLRKRYFEKPVNLTIRAKQDFYNGEARSNVTVIDAKPVSYGEHGRLMLKNIHELLALEAKAGA